MEFNPDQKFSLSPDVIFQEVGGEMVLLDMASEHYFGLDAVGARIWSLLQEGSTVGETLNVLMAEYEVEQGVLRQDLGDLIENLLNAGLIRQ